LVAIRITEVCTVPVPVVKIVATMMSDFNKAIKCTKIDFCWSSAPEKPPDPAAGAYSASSDAPD